MIPSHIGESWPETDVLNRRLLAGGLFAISSVVVLAFLQNPSVLLLAAIFFSAVISVLVYPVAGVYWIVVLTPFESLLNLEFNVLKLLKLVIIAIIVLRLHMEPRHPGVSSDPYRRVLQLILACALFATLLAPSPLRSAVGLTQFLIFCGYYFVVCRTRISSSQAIGILRTLVLVSLPVAALAVLQSLFGYSGLLGSKEQQAMALQDSFVTFWPSIQRASSSFGSSNAAGAFFTVAMLVALIHALLLTESRVRYCFLTVTSALGLAATFSRGALIGLLVSLLFLFAMLRRARFRWMLILSVVGFIVAGLVFAPLPQVMGYLRVNDDLLSASVSRVQAWEGAWIMIRQHPLSGIGFYEFKQGMLTAEGDPEAPLHPHNGVLKALVEEGVLGGAAYLCYLMVFVRTSVRTMRQFAHRPALLWVFSSIAVTGVCFFSQELVDAGLTMGGSSLAILFATLLAVQTSLRDSLETTAKLRSV